MKIERLEDFVPGKMYAITGISGTKVGMYIKHSRVNILKDELKFVDKVCFLVNGKVKTYFKPENSYFAFELLE